MDEQLAAIYGTGDQAVSENDLEKVAAAELLVKIAEDQGVDLNSFSDEDVMEMVGELSKSAEHEGTAHSEEAKKGLAQFAKEEAKEKESAGDDEKKEEASEKVAEADYLGRVMAHAYVQEMGDIEKTALSKVEVGMRARDFARKLPGVSDILEGLATRKSGRGVVDAARSTASKAISRSGIASQRQGRAASKLENLLGAKGRKTMSEGTKRALIGGAKAGGTVGGIGLAGYGAHKALSKESSALDALAERRALAMLEEAGYETQEKTASAVEVAVEQRALEMLEANGYPVEWNQ